MEPHGTIINCRWHGTRGAEVGRSAGGVIVRPFNDTAPTQDSRINLHPGRTMVIPPTCWKLDEVTRDP